MTAASNIPAGIGIVALAEEGVDFIIRNLSTMYTDPVHAVLREWVANAVDSVTTAYARGEIDTTDNTIAITLPDYKNTTLEVTDYGLGMDRAHVYNYALNYGRSSKRDDTATSGKFGLGLKSGLAVANQFLITSVRDGKKTTGFLSLGEIDKGVENYCSEAVDTDEANHTTLSVTLGADSIYSMEHKIIRVIGGYDPKMFTIKYASGDYIFKEDSLREAYYFNDDNPSLGETVFANKEHGNWQITAVVGGVSYPIYDGCRTHAKQINDAIEKALADHDFTRKLDFYMDHVIVCPVDGVDIPDNRDTLIFSSKTITTLANAYAKAIVEAHQRADDYFDSMTLLSVLKDTTTPASSAAFRLMREFAPQFEDNVGIKARCDAVIKARYADRVNDEFGNVDDMTYGEHEHNELTNVVRRDLDNYSCMRTNNAGTGFAVREMPTYGILNGSPKPDTAMFVRFDLETRKQVSTFDRELYNGTTVNEEVTSYLDDKGKAHDTPAKCIEAVCKHYRVRINTWREEHGNPTVIFGPTEEAYVWVAEDFTEVIDFDEFITRCTAAHDARTKARRAERKANAQTTTGPKPVARYAMFHYRKEGYELYNDNVRDEGTGRDATEEITIDDLTAFAAESSIDPAVLPIVAMTKGVLSTFKDDMHDITQKAPGVVPVAVFIRTTKLQMKHITNAGFNRVFTKREFIEHCQNTDRTYRDAFLAGLSDEDRAAVDAYVAVQAHSPIVRALTGQHIILPGTRNSEELFDGIAEQFAETRGIDITERAGYQFITSLVTDAVRGRVLLNERMPEDTPLRAYAHHDHDDTTWQFTGDVIKAFDGIIPKLGDMDNPNQYAACALLEIDVDRHRVDTDRIGLYTNATYEQLRERNKALINEGHSRSDLSVVERYMLSGGNAKDVYDRVVRICQMDW